MDILFWRGVQKSTEFQGVAIEKSQWQILKVYFKLSIEFVQQNFTIYPYISTKQIENNQKYISFPVKSQWFNFNSIHEIEKKALPEWFKTRKAMFGSVVIINLSRNQISSKKIKNYTKNIATILSTQEEINMFHQLVLAKVWREMLVQLSKSINFFKNGVSLTLPSLKDLKKPIFHLSPRKEFIWKKEKIVLIKINPYARKPLTKMIQNS